MLGIRDLKLETLAQTRLPDGGQAWHARVYFLAINFIILRIRIIFLRCRASRSRTGLGTGRADWKLDKHN